MPADPHRYLGGVPDAVRSGEVAAYDTCINAAGCCDQIMPGGLNSITNQEHAGGLFGGSERGVALSCT